MSLKQSLIIQKEKILHRIKKEKMGSEFQLPLQLDSSDNILICLPESNQENLSRSELTKEYQRFFSSQEIVFCSPTIFQTELATIKKGFYYDLTGQYSAKKISDLLFAEIKIKTYKLAIDLNFEFSLIPALICKATVAPIRMSFDKQNAHLFYNIVVSHKTNNKTYNQSLQLLRDQLKTIVQNKI
jgi:hypothetical protein